MSLQERLDRIREGAKARIPAPMYEMMTKAVADLAASGQAARALKVGDRMPSFELPAAARPPGRPGARARPAGGVGGGARRPGFGLPGAAGRRVASDALLARGPLVVSFYRGR